MGEEGLVNVVPPLLDLPDVLGALQDQTFVLHHIINVRHRFRRRFHERHCVCGGGGIIILVMSNTV